MAVLKYLPLLAAVACKTIPATASPTPHALHTRAAAWRALEHCDRMRASYWADELERLNPAQATLYKLAWLEAPQTATAVSALESWAPMPGDNLAWKTTPEIWADEERLPRSQCLPDDPKFKTFARLPQPVTQDLLRPLLVSYTSQPATLRAALRDFALHEWLQGRSLALDNTTSVPGSTVEESCEWRAIQALHAVPADASALGEIARECMASRNPATPASALLWAIVQTTAGDQFLKTGRTELAFAAFSAAVGLMPQNEMPKALFYRLAVSGILSGASDDTVLRAAHSALRSDEDGDISTPADALPAPLRASLGNLVCDRLSVLRPRDALVNLQRVFKHDALVPTALKVTESCSQSISLFPLWSLALAKARNLTERSQLLERMLTGALVHGNQGAATGAAQGLAKLSRQGPYVASRAFWSALEQASGRQSSATLQSTIKTYRHRGSWLPSDDLKLKRLNRQEKAVSHEHTPLLTNSHSDPQTIEIPMAAMAEPLTIQADIRTDFRSRVKAELLK